MMNMRGGSTMPRYKVESWKGMIHATSTQAQQNRSHCAEIKSHWNMKFQARASA